MILLKYKKHKTILTHKTKIYLIHYLTIFSLKKKKLTDFLPTKEKKAN